MDMTQYSKLSNDFPSPFVYYSDWCSLEAMGSSLESHHKLFRSIAEKSLGNNYQFPVC